MIPLQAFLAHHRWLLLCGGVEGVTTLGEWVSGQGRREGGGGGKGRGEGGRGC